MSEFKDEYLKVVLNQLDSLTLYGAVNDDPVLVCLKNICIGIEPTLNFSKMVSYLIESAERFGFSGNLFKNHILTLFLYDENRFSLYCENNQKVENTSLYNLAVNDIRILKSLITVDINTLSDNSPSVYEILNYKPVNKNKNELLTYINTIFDERELLDNFVRFYKTSGCGNMSLYRAFKFDEKSSSIVGIEKPDPITFDDIIGYKSQTEELVSNTLAFIKGFPANNVLLVGSRGTGKSSSVKALVNKFFSDGLRLIEITKEQIVKLPEILSLLKNRGRRFIIFIDDLSFDEHEIQYKYMKSLIEGGSQNKPDNVLFYATSNRRHLVSEKWGDRQRGSDEAEIHTQDTLNEKLSLADRFGITISYPKPTPKEYINMVKVMAGKEGILLSDEALEREALKWEINQKGISGRTARQFINNLIWQTENV